MLDETYIREFPKACSTRLLGALGAIEFQSIQGSKPPTMYSDPVFQTNGFLLSDWFFQWNNWILYNHGETVKQLLFSKHGSHFHILEIITSVSI